MQVIVTIEEEEGVSPPRVSPPRYVHQLRKTDFCSFQEKVLRLSPDLQAADPVEPPQGALRQDGGGQRGQGRQHTKEFHS